MAGYSGTPLEKKLGVKDGVTVFLDGAPAGFTLEAPTTTRLSTSVELSLTFHTSRKALEQRFPKLRDRTTPAGMIWVCWPKKAAQKVVPSDLDENIVRRIGLDAGMVDVKVAAIDETWSALKFVRRLVDR